MLLLLISLVAGFLTILAPCVLPLLPIIIGGSLSARPQNKGRPYLIAGALAASIIGFTLLLKVSTSLANLSSSTLNYLSGGLIIALGLLTAAPEIWEWIVIRLNWEAASLRWLGGTQQQKGKYLGPVLIGLALGPVFSSCSPTYAFILASVLPRDFLNGLVYLIAYVVALVAALLLVALLGRKFIAHVGWAVNTHSLFRRVVGIVFIVVGVLIITGQETKLEVALANHLPFDETRLEQVLLNKQHTPVAPKLTGSAPESVSDNGALNTYPTPAPEFQGLTNWINSPPLTLAGLQGKVVLVDFWTYSCINCIRTLPYLEKWQQTYASKGLVIVGVNTPEFAFEHVPANVARAVKSFGITYPVVLDNDYATWDAYNNNSWPSDYLIDKTGDIRYVASGEGDYGATETAIQALLGLHSSLVTPTSNVPISQDQTPETYFGTNRADNYSGSPGLSGGQHSFTATPASRLAANSWTLSGKWNISPESITAVSGAELTFSVQAKDVYVVAANANGQTDAATVAVDGNHFGADAPNGKLAITSDRLYHIVSLPQFGGAIVTLKLAPGTSLYTFTFGS